MARVLVTRPLPEGDATAERLRARGHEVIVSPLFEARALAWTLPERGFDAVLLTSARALLRPVPKTLHKLPVYAVGPSTAAAARAVGIIDVREGMADLAALLSQMGGAGEVLWLAGRERTEADPPPGVRLTIVDTYAMEPLPLTGAAVGALAGPDPPLVLLYSARAAAHFGAEVDRARIARARLTIAAISAKALAAAGAGWSEALAAASPNEAAMFEAAGL